MMRGGVGRCELCTSGNVSHETLVRICVDDTVRGSVMLLSWRYGRCYCVGCLIWDDV